MTYLSDLNHERGQFLRDVAGIAFYGSISYWAYYEGNNRISEHGENSNSHERYMPVPIDENLIDLGIKRILLNEVQVRQDIRKEIALADILNDASHIDAEAADCIVQAGLFAGIVYS